MGEPLKDPNPDYPSLKLLSLFETKKQKAVLCLDAFDISANVSTM
jgi:hypothetical protein